MIFHILNGLGLVLGSAGVVLGGPIAFYLSAPHKILIAPPYFKVFPKTAGACRGVRCEATFSPTFSATPKSLSATSHFEAPSLIEWWVLG